MKKSILLLSLSLCLVMLAATSHAFASPTSLQSQVTPGANTPGAKATEKAENNPAKQEDVLRGKHENFKGTVSAAEPTSISLTLRDGSSITIGLSAETRLKFPGPKESASAGILPGVTAMVQAIRDQGGNLIARSVMVIPGKPSKIHRVGIVTEYTAGGSITIEDKDGNVFTFALNAETKLLPAGRAETLGIGSLVTIIAPRDPALGGVNVIGIVIHPSGT